MSRRHVALLAGVAVAAAGAFLAAPSAGAAAGTATVSVVHGIPNTPVNVFVNGKDTLKDFKPGTVAGPLQLPAGNYQIKVYPAANVKGTGTPVIAASATLSAGQNVSLVAHLTAAGKPTLTPFANDTGSIPAGKARLIVRHTAAAPAVDVRANGTPVLKNLTNPDQASIVVPAGSVKADVVLAGTSTVAIGPATLDLAAGSDTIVYAIGSASDKTLSLVTQTIGGLGAAPGGVPAGNGGQAVASSSATPVWAWAVLATGLLLITAAAGARFRPARSRR